MVTRDRLTRLALCLLCVTSSCTKQQLTILPIARTRLERPECARPQSLATRSFLIFFDSHSDRIPSPRGPLILSELAQFWTDEHGIILGVTGYTDAAEVAQRDHDLGRRRASAAAAFLAAAGVPGDRIFIKDGGSHLLVPTPPGVPEQQNRRVEFIIATAGSDTGLYRRLDCATWLEKHYCDESNSAQDGETCKAVVRALSPLSGR